MKDHNQPQYCSHCQQAIDLSGRYPRRICNDCYQLLTDKEGRAIAYVNDDFSDSVQGFYTDVNPPVPYDSLTCYINESAFRAEEGRFGGVVVQHLPGVRK
ncbi:hypothetical protein [Microscilla marina]|uniref:Uncharacterized protein n=1 Tax=Microscilla marina ATCC 23134 TaxID=313606 RepID=A1ZFS5_MICM2|nr:hypothetical protein [Microscilla marina]EAY30849.1 conserved hypothetical protein [Microscilla marina ATCC 23134]